MANESQKAWRRICVKHGLEESHRLEEIGWVCPECRKDYPPAPHHIKALEKIEALKLTLPQREMLDQIRTYGEFGYSPNDHNFGSRTRLCKKLVDMGLAYAYPHGGFSITEAGRYLLSHSKDGGSNG